MNETDTEGTIVAALRTRHPDRMGEWMFLTDVGNDPQSATRRADALALNLWSSRGFALHGYEVKVSRSDWLTELKQPAKAQTFWDWCRYWTLAVPGVGREAGGHGVTWHRQNIVAEDELPEGWGLAVWNGTRWYNPIKAKSHDTKPFTKGFMVSLIRAAGKASPERDGLRREYERGYQSGQDEGRRQRGAAERRQAQTAEMLAQFEAEVGAPLASFVDDWAREWRNVPVEERLAAIRTLVVGPAADSVATTRLQQAADMLHAGLRALESVAHDAGLTLTESEEAR